MPKMLAPTRVAPTLYAVQGTTVLHNGEPVCVTKTMAWLWSPRYDRWVRIRKGLVPSYLDAAQAGPEALALWENNQDYALMPYGWSPGKPQPPAKWILRVRHAIPQPRGRAQA